MKHTLLPRDDEEASMAAPVAKERALVVFEVQLRIGMPDKMRKSTSFGIQYKHDSGTYRRIKHMVMVACFIALETFLCISKDQCIDSGVVINQLNQINREGSSERHHDQSSTNLRFRACFECSSRQNVFRTAQPWCGRLADSTNRRSICVSNSLAHSFNRSLKRDS